ncbi:MAG: hypothetical protein WBA22_18790 [Candidatus Methanofastidiosia archaeon]
MTCIYPGFLIVEKFHCEGETTYEKGKPLEISVFLELSHTISGEGSVELHILRKRFWSYQRIHSKRMPLMLDTSARCIKRMYLLCVPGYETREFNGGEILKIRFMVQMSGESVSGETSWTIVNKEEFSQVLLS